jgi:N-acetyl-gamma-glutamyl-phosphate reductase
MSNKMNVGIVGVSGYGGGELARLLAQHPDINLTYVTSGTYAGQPLQKALPGASPQLKLTCEKFELSVAAEKCDVLFLAGENGLAMKIAPQLLEAGKKIIDLSADFRLKDVAAYKEWYKAEHTAPQLLSHAVYGLPELNKKAIANAQLVANPGCYPTSAALALAPLLAEKLIDHNTIIVDSMSGVSGAGRSKFCLDYHFSEVNESARPYGVGGVHRHTPEIEQTLSQLTVDPVVITFTPHLIPITRGILTTAYASTDEKDVEKLLSLYRSYYESAPFVNVLDEGFPATKHTYGTNYCHIGLTIDRRTNRVVVISAIDNLVKGAAGQAIQNMNLMCGFDETAGLAMGAVWP